MRTLQRRKEWPGGGRKMICIIGKPLRSLSYKGLHDAVLTKKAVSDMKGRNKPIVRANAVHHVYQNTRNGYLIFYSVKDYLILFSVISVFARRYGVQILGISLMPDHIHLLVYVRDEPPLSPDRTYVQHTVRLCAEIGAQKNPVDHCLCLQQSRRRAPCIPSRRRPLELSGVCQQKVSVFGKTPHRQGPMGAPKSVQYRKGLQKGGKMARLYRNRQGHEKLVTPGNPAVHRLRDPEIQLYRLSRHDVLLRIIRKDGVSAKTTVATKR